MTEQWRELKETITEMRDNDGTGTQQEVCKFLANLMDVLEKQMSNQNKGDLISRQAVDDAIYDYSRSCDVNYAQIMEYIDKIPSVENKGENRPKGHWIGHREHCENLGMMPSGLGAYEWCSNCDCGIDVREWHRNDYNYCPKCGTDMRGEE